MYHIVSYCIGKKSFKRCCIHQKYLDIRTHAHSFTIDLRHLAVFLQFPWYKTVQCQANITFGQKVNSNTLMNESSRTTNTVINQN